MTTVDRVKSLCKENKIAISKLERDLGFANGYISQLRKGTFPDDRLRKIADYFNVSVEFLLNLPRTAHIDMIEEVYGKEAADAYINGDFVTYRKIVDENKKKPAPIAESELSDLQKQAIQFVLSLSDDQLRKFISIGKLLIEEK